MSAPTITSQTPVPPARPALMRTTRNNPKYSVMFVDDIGIELAKREGLIEKLPREQIPNLERVLPRFVYFDGFGAAFAMSAAGLCYNTATGKPHRSLASRSSTSPAHLLLP